MPAFSTFVRCLPPSMLLRYFERFAALDLSDLDWDADRPAIAGDLIRRWETWDPALRGKIAADTDRVWAMADELGQAVLYGAWQARDDLDGLAGGYARAMHVFLMDKEAFRRAEATRYADDRRFGKIWNGFRGERGQSVARDGSSAAAFATAVGEHFGTSNVHVEIYDRSRPVLDAAPAALVQVNAYREGRLDEDWEFVDGRLDRRTRRPVAEAAVSYAPASGVVEVVARDRETRIAMVRLFARHLLSSEIPEEKGRFRLYDLSPLLCPHQFPTDPGDGIEGVRVVMLRLAPHDTAAERLTLEVARQGGRDIWSFAELRFGTHNPLLGGWSVVQAKLAIRFLPGAGGRPARTLHVTVSSPDGCDLKERTDDERIVGERYLRRWGLLRDV
jgi:hypothetical protein